MEERHEEMEAPEVLAKAPSRTRRLQPFGKNSPTATGMPV